MTRFLLVMNLNLDINLLVMDLNLYINLLVIDSNLYINLLVMDLNLYYFHITPFSVWFVFSPQNGAV